MTPNRFCALCLMFLSLVGAFDLVCTLSAHHAGWLGEMNPAAGYVLDFYGPAALVFFKVVFTATACLAFRAAVLAGWRKRPTTLLAGTVALFTICAIIVLQWIRCFAVAPL